MTTARSHRSALLRHVYFFTLPMFAEIVVLYSDFLLPGISIAAFIVHFLISLKRLRIEFQSLQMIEKEQIEFMEDFG